MLLEASDVPPPICPRCGCGAAKHETRYGPRHECCGLWSWGGKPLADANTHEVRRKLAPLMKQVHDNIGIIKSMREITKRSGIHDPKKLMIGEMNEVTARKVLAVVEDMVMDIMSGELTK